jgi:hypothetical protein
MSQKPPETQRSGVILTAAVAAFVAGVVALVVVLFLASAVTGFADGDPPSDYLLGRQVYLPLTPPSAASGDQLKAVVAAANKDGYTIRVAVIQAPQDLGSIPQLMGKPRTYAKFLGAEIAFAYKGRLLTVMRNGYGISQNGGKRVPNGYQQLRAVPLPAGSSPDALTDAATAAVRHLAAANGHPLPQNLPGVSTSSGPSFVSKYRTTIGAAALILGGAAVAGGVLLFSRRR